MSTNPTEWEIAARAFHALCMEQNFFKKTENARTLLEPAKNLFPGTSACWDFLMEYDICDVGYGAGDPALPDIAPAEWLASLGIDPERGRWGIFDPSYVAKFEEERLRRYSRGERHWMVGKKGGDPALDVLRWRRLVARWQYEFFEHYGRQA